jgi:hypothetical protein
MFKLKQRLPLGSLTTLAVGTHANGHGLGPGPNGKMYDNSGDLPLCTGMTG